MGFIDFFKKLFGMVGMEARKGFLEFTTSRLKDALQLAEKIVMEKGLKRSSITEIQEQVIKQFEDALTAELKKRFPMVPDTWLAWLRVSALEHLKGKGWL